MAYSPALSGGGAAAAPDGMSALFIRSLQVISACLSLTFAAILIYTIQTDGSPFRSSLLTPWMNATLVDFYFVMGIAWAWICIRERTLAAKVFWIVVRGSPRRSSLPWPGRVAGAYCNCWHAAAAGRADSTCGTRRAQLSRCAPQ